MKEAFRGMMTHKTKSADSKACGLRLLREAVAFLGILP